MLRETTTVPSRLTMRLSAPASTAVVVVVVAGWGVTTGGWVAVCAGCVAAGTGSVATAGVGSVLTLSTVGGGWAGLVLAALAANCVGAGSGVRDFSSIEAATKA